MTDISFKLPVEGAPVEWAAKNWASANERPPLSEPFQDAAREPETKPVPRPTEYHPAEQTPEMKAQLYALWCAESGKNNERMPGLTAQEYARLRRDLSYPPCPPKP